jgi:hypothetical protein
MRKLPLCSPGLVALALVGGCSDPPLFIRITELRMEPAQVSRGDNTRLFWRVEKNADAELFSWMTLFQGKYDAESAQRADPDVTGAPAFTGETQGEFACRVDQERRLTCRAEGEAAESWLLEERITTFTLRACILGFDTTDSASDADCDYATVELELR